MDEFRTQLRNLIDAMRADGIEPAFLVVDLEGAAQIKAHGIDSLDNFKDAAVRTVVNITGGADAFTYGDDRVVAILGSDFGRLKTFSVIEKLRRAIPLLGQSFDCYLRPNFDVIEYDEQKGIGALITQITTRKTQEELSA